jgi:hypothetical protein
VLNPKYHLPFVLRQAECFLRKPCADVFRGYRQHNHNTGNGKRTPAFEDDFKVNQHAYANEKKRNEKSIAYKLYTVIGRKYAE